MSNPGPVRKERAGAAATGIVIRAMGPEDWERVRAVYCEGLATGRASFEAEAPDWDGWDRVHHGHSRLVAGNGDEVIGWAALAPVSHRECYAGVAEASVYVSRSQWGRGVGRRLLSALVRESEQYGIWTVCGTTLAENEASLRMQLACGFRVVGRRERVALRDSVWHDTILTERRSPVVGAAG